MASISIIAFVFAAIWYVDPALLTLMLRFRQAECRTKQADFLRGISNCTWTSCKLGCTREVYQCWQIQVQYTFTNGSKAFLPPWAPLSNLVRQDPMQESDSKHSGTSKLYPNVRGCGYPPELNCEDFFTKFGMSKNGISLSETYPCWISTMDNGIAMTNLDLVSFENFEC